MTNLIDLTLNDLVNKVKSKEISSKEITTAYIDRSKQSKKLNTYVEETFDSAIKSSEKTILIAIYNNQNQRRYIGVKLN